MGEAKRRGAFEKRRDAAMIRDAVRRAEDERLRAAEASRLPATVEPESERSKRVLARALLTAGFAFAASALSRQPGGD